MSKEIKYMMALTALALAGLSQPTVAQQVSIVDFGLYTATNIKVLPSANSPTGQGRTFEAELIKQTDRVPAVLNTKFGFRFKVQGRAEGSTVKLRLKFTFPEMTNSASGKVSSSFEGVGDAPVGKVLGMYWDFVHPWEMSPGRWTMSIYDGEHLLAQKVFTVTKDKKDGVGTRDSKPRGGESGRPEGFPSGLPHHRTCGSAYGGSWQS